MGAFVSVVQSLVVALSRTNTLYSQHTEDTQTADRKQV